MKKNKPLLITVSASVLIVFLLNIFVFSHNISINILLILFLLFLTWWFTIKNAALFSQFDQKQAEFNRVLKERDLYFERSNNADHLLNSLEGVVYTFDKKNEEHYFSKGIEGIFDIPVSEFNSHPTYWKVFVYPDDLEKVEKDERLLQDGRTTRTEFRIVQSDGTVKWLVNVAKPILDESGNIVKVNGQMKDITIQKELEYELRRMAYYDDLTDLPNRKSLDRHIEKALARSKRHEHNFTLMFVDLDDFKKVNDTMGHDAGDVLLKMVVGRIKESIRDEDLIARIGGDEFILVFEETNIVDIEEIAERIVNAVSKPYLINGREATISVSIGISMYPNDGENKEMLIEHADKAMYFAKNNGKNSYKVFTSDLEEMEIKRVSILERWKNAFQKPKWLTKS